MTPRHLHVRPNPKIAEVARDAKAVILDRGWTQCVLEESPTPVKPHWYSRTVLKPGPVCLVGAINVAETGAAKSYGSLRTTEPVLLALAEVIYGDDATMAGPMTWNDRPGRTKDQVIGLLDRVIERHTPKDVHKVPAEATQADMELAGGDPQ